MISLNVRRQTGSCCNKSWEVNVSQDDRGNGGRMIIDFNKVVISLELHNFPLNRLTVIIIHLLDTKANSESFLTAYFFIAA